MSWTIRDLLAQGCVRIVLDLKKVSFLDSAGLGELAANIKRARERGGDIRLLRAPRRIRDLFDLVGLARVIRMFDDEQAAVRSFKE
jgi:anti-sigma B factor antagonist